MDPLFIISCLILGAVAGFLGGLLGIGGGVIMVPVLLALFTQFGWNEALSIKMAIATSLSAIIFTSIAAIRAQIRRDAILWPLVKTWTPFILLGSFCSGTIANFLPSLMLKGFIGCFLLLAAIVMLVRWAPAPHRQLPGKVGAGITSFIAGLASALAGIGGGNIIVPTLTWFNVPMKNATATSSTLGLPISVFGAAGFITAGWGMPELPQYSLGFVYLPAVALIAVMTFVLAPVGVAVAHKISAANLKQVFGLLLLMVSGRMLYGMV
ncbi:MAG: sulfite exporter TauE/SafE family protein [Algicola sp.]|nr:sulfite exporter TauE/SafE family protein [Algicola sp.]